MSLKEKVKSYLDAADPFIKLIFKTGKIHLPTFQEVGDFVNSIKVEDRMISRNMAQTLVPTPRGLQLQPIVMVNSSNQIFSPPTRMICPPQRQLVQRKLSYASRATDSKWSCEEDTKMNMYKGKGTFIKLSGCKDDQTSADGFVNMENGAMTGCIITLFKNKPGKLTIGEFLFNIRNMLAQNRFEQVPQIGSNNVIDSSAVLPF
jgi:hypothetical protein